MAINQSLKTLLKGSLVGAGVAICAATPAQAASFSQFTFGSTTDYNNNPTEDIMLQSVTKTGSSHTITHFNLVNAAQIIANEDASSTQLGAGSSDAGDNASNAASIVNEKPDADAIVGALGNLNLNNIIDTEDKAGKSVFDVTFDAPVNTFYFFERGRNSDLRVEALDSLGNVIENTLVKIDRYQWSDAGYQIDTTEIAAAQDVGSYGLKFGRDIAGLRISSFGILGDNGPDYKVVAAKTPEASSIAALGMVASSMLLLRFRRKAA